MASLPATQRSIALAEKRTPYIQLESPVHPPTSGEIVIRVHWTASTPLDLHRADGGLLVSAFPFRTGGGGVAGVVVAVGSDGDLKGLQVGDRVSAFAFRGGKEANHQEYVTVPAYLVSKVPEGIALEDAVTVPVNLVTVFHAMTKDLELQLPWPVPEGWNPEQAESPILVWGASSSVGMYALQVLRHWGYKNLIAVSSEKHHEYLKTLGARLCFDYTKPDVTSTILAALKSPSSTFASHDDDDGEKPSIPYILDCIGSLTGTLKPLTHLAQRGTLVAIMLPVILQDATPTAEPSYEMDVSQCLRGEWAEGVILRGVRTHFYLEDDFFKERLQPEILPALLRAGVVRPNRYRVVEGATMVERAQNALTLLRGKDVSGEKLIWRVSDV